MWIRPPKSSLPRSGGEGDHPKGGGGVAGAGLRHLPLHQASPGPPPRQMPGRIFSVFLPLLLLAACQEQTAESPFPKPKRPVSPITSASYSNEDARDSVREAETVMDLA